jgi:prepilin-type processing-associated H-X9-DG protein
MHNPYGRFPAKGSRSASFAYAADMSPWFVNGDIIPPSDNNREWWKNVALFPADVSDSSSYNAREKIMQANTMSHGREGQNVMFADGHSEYARSSDVGVKHDNIYTFWSNVLDSIGFNDSVEKDSKVPDVSESDKRIGTNPTSRSKENDAKSVEDSFLAI